MFMILGFPLVRVDVRAVGRVDAMGEMCTKVKKCRESQEQEPELGSASGYITCPRGDGSGPQRGIEDSEDQIIMQVQLVVQGEYSQDSPTLGNKMEETDARAWKGVDSVTLRPTHSHSPTFSNVLKQDSHHESSSAASR